MQLLWLARFKEFGKLRILGVLHGAKKGSSDWLPETLAQSVQAESCRINDFYPPCQIYHLILTFTMKQNNHIFLNSK
jgi:hypothetical protein